MSGVVSAIILGVSAILFVLPGFLMKDFSKKSALRIMFASFLYLPIVLVVLYIDRSCQLISAMDTPVDKLTTSKTVSVNPKRFILWLFIVTIIMLFAALTALAYHG